MHRSVMLGFPAFKGYVAGALPPGVQAYIYETMLKSLPSLLIFCFCREIALCLQRVRMGNQLAIDSRLTRNSLAQVFGN